MNHPPDKFEPRAGPSPEAEKACDGCGRFGAVAVGGHYLCVDCYDACGSCCQGSILEQPGSGG